jgi:hypothetical protein
MSGLVSENPSDGIHELRGTLMLSDLVRFQYFHSLRRTWWFVITVALVVFVASILATVLALVFDDSRIATYGSPILLLFLMWVGAVVVLPQSAARKQLKTGASLREEIIYTFSAQGIHYSSAFSSGETSWKAFWGICETKSLFCLYFTATSALVLPKRFLRTRLKRADGASS